MLSYRVSFLNRTNTLIFIRYAPIFSLEKLKNETHIFVEYFPLFSLLPFFQYSGAESGSSLLRGIQDINDGYSMLLDTATGELVQSMDHWEGKGVDLDGVSPPELELEVRNME